MSDERRARWITGLLLAAVALLGVAWLAVLPPFEGHDETAHWSYVQELADTGHGPAYGRDGLSKDLDAYPGPMRYGDNPPFQRTGRPTYRNWREAGAPRVAGAPGRYHSGGELNWQAQHPALYYALMAPLFRAARPWGWLDQMLALRLASYALAFAGLAVGVLGARPAAGLWSRPIMAAWPLLVPEFFAEFARLGNDSLCLLLMGAAWALLTRMLADPDRPRWGAAAGLGAVLGLGLLTKAFFLTIGAGMGAVLLAHWLTSGRRPALLGQALLCGALALAIGAWWYVLKRLETGSFSGSDEFIRLQQAGGAKALIENFDAGEFGQGLALIASSFVWGGTWSGARAPTVLLAAPLALIVVLGLGYLRGVKLQRPIDWAPLALALPMLAGLVYHVFVWMAGAAAETPGWYLHILAAPLGFAFARGWRRPRLLAALTGLTAVSTMAAWGLQLSLFSGCAAKLGSSAAYSFSGAGCLVSLRGLAALGHPVLGLTSLVLGALLALCAGVLALSAFRPGPDREPAAFTPAA